MRVVVVAKAPEPGRVKTRLAAALGPERAAELAAAFLDDALALAARCGTPILATTRPDVRPGVETWLQGEGDLGERLERLATRGAPCVLVGADSPAMPDRTVRDAIAAIAADRAALAPADDGGFTLLGLPRCPPGLFAGIAWSAATTGEAMAEALARHGLPPVRLSPGWDVDEPADLDRLRREVDPAHAPHTFALLNR